MSLYDLHKLASFPIFIVIALFIGLLGVISAISLLFPKSKGGGIDGLKKSLNDMNIKKPIAIIVCLLCSFVLAFSNNTIVWFLGGQEDLRLAPDGTCCYNVIASREFSNKEYTLPAKIKKIESSYFVENIYFSNGGYLYFNSYEYVDFDETITDADQDGEFWDIRLTNQKVNHPSVYENYNAIDTDLVLSLIGTFCLILISVILMLTKNGKKVSP